MTQVAGYDATFTTTIPSDWPAEQCAVSVWGTGRESAGSVPVAQCGLSTSQSRCGVNSAAIADAGALFAKEGAF